MEHLLCTSQRPNNRICQVHVCTIFQQYHYASASQPNSPLHSHRNTSLECSFNPRTGSPQLYARDYTNRRSCVNSSSMNSQADFDPNGPTSMILFQGFLMVHYHRAYYATNNGHQRRTVAVPLNDSGLLTRPPTNRELGLS